MVAVSIQYHQIAVLLILPVTSTSIYYEDIISSKPLAYQYIVDNTLAESQQQSPISGNIIHNFTVYSKDGVQLINYSADYNQGYNADLFVNGSTDKIVFKKINTLNHMEISDNNRENHLPEHKNFPNANDYAALNDVGEKFFPSSRIPQRSNSNVATQTTIDTKPVELQNMKANMHSSKPSDKYLPPSIFNLFLDIDQDEKTKSNPHPGHQPTKFDDKHFQDFFAPQFLPQSFNSNSLKKHPVENYNYQADDMVTPNYHLVSESSPLPPLTSLTPSNYVVNSDNKYKETSNEATEKYLTKPTKYFTAAKLKPAAAYEYQETINEISTTETKVPIMGNDDSIGGIEIKSFVNLGNNYQEENQYHQDVVNTIEDDILVYTYHSSTIKPFISNHVDLGTQNVTPEESTKASSTTVAPILSTESFFMEHNKVEEISLEENDDQHAPEISIDNNFEEFDDGNFLRFMNNFGAQIKKALFSNQSETAFDLADDSEKYFSLFKDFQEFKIKATATPHPTTETSVLTSSYTTTTAQTTTKASTTTTRSTTKHTTSIKPIYKSPSTSPSPAYTTTAKSNILKTILEKFKLPKATTKTTTLPPTYTTSTKPNSVLKNLLSKIKVPILKTTPLPSTKQPAQHYDTNNTGTSGFLNIIRMGQNIVQNKVASIVSQFVSANQSWWCGVSVNTAMDKLKNIINSRLGFLRNVFGEKTINKYVEEEAAKMFKC